MAGLTDISLGNFTEVLYGAVGDAPGTMTKLGEVQTVGDLTDEATIVDVQAYGQKYLKKLVGSANASAIEVVCNYNPSDAGQIDLLSAYNLSEKRQIVLVMNEDEAGTNGTYNSFPALIASASVTNSFDETRTITFSIVPTDGLGTFEAKPFV